MPQLESGSVPFTLWKLRRYVTVCGVVMGLALITHLFIWSMLTFTEVRFDTVEMPAQANMVVGDEEASAMRGVVMPVGVDVRATDVRPEPIRVRSTFDQLFQDLSGVTLAAGTITVPAMILLISIGVIMIATTGRHGADKLISALIWSVLVAALALPVGRMLDLPWRIAGLQPYDDLVDKTTAGAGFGNHLQVLVLYGTALLGLGLVVTRFRGGVNMSLPKHLESLDPELEREVAAMKTTTHHGGGGRTAAALHGVVSGMPAGSAGLRGPSGSPLPAVPPPIDDDRLPSASSVSPGNRPRRII